MAPPVMFGACIAVFGLAGWALQALPPQSYSSQILVDVSSFAELSLGSPSTADGSDRFVQAEVLYLNSDAFDALSRSNPQLGAGLISISASQDGNSNVIAISTKSSNSEDSAAQAQVVAGVYLTREQATLAQRLDAVSQQLTAVDTDLKQVQSEAGAAIPALQSEYARLLAEANDLRIAMRMADAPSPIIGAPSVDGPTSNRSTTRGVLLGVLVGALVALGVTIGIRTLRARHPQPANESLK